MVGDSAIDVATRARGRRAHGGVTYGFDPEGLRGAGRPTS